MMRKKYGVTGLLILLAGMLLTGQKIYAEDAGNVNPDVKYQTHIQDYGWETDWKADGEMSGTTGEAKRLEAIRISLENQSYTGDIQYRTHIQDYGWETGWKADGEMSGTSGEAKRLEAIQIQLTEEMSEHYDIYYRVHAQDYGWLDWAKNGESAGTAGYGKHLEAIEIQLVSKGEAAPGATDQPFRQALVSYQTHVQDYGWQAEKKDGEMSGTTGESKRLEAIRIRFQNQPYAGDVKYRTHVQDYGWETGWKANGEMSGTTGEAKRLEAIQIQLTGEMAEHYDVYYRTHVENFGWLGWAKNGENSGSAGYGYRLEGIQIMLVTKGGDAPGPTENSFHHYTSWVSGLKAAEQTSQLIIVSVDHSSYATVSMHTKDADGYWSDDYKVAGRVGKNGIGKTKEGDKKTPTGIFSFGQAFGVADNPGVSAGSYLKVNKNHYWVSDSNSQYYNQLVDISKTGKQWTGNEAEHLINYPVAYKYAVAVNYNTECVPGAGSAIFFHCTTGNATAGCITVDEGYMKYTLQNLKSDAKIIIDYKDNLKNY